MSVFAPEAVNALQQIISKPAFMKRKDADEVNQSIQTDQAISDQPNLNTRVNNIGHIERINGISQDSEMNEGAELSQVDEDNEESSGNNEVESESESSTGEAEKGNLLQAVEQI
ncbi:hypothetical protein FLONG3_6747 [Fusarium longipes]|uniref:Uncharacterized protein n=1 Tax=Fusarium longipes TaxID=694270 RepID=A0A395SIY5_9HYPO|nr:hypothetical protein FLONG3_6747 [Fusarium longipes]